MNKSTEIVTLFTIFLFFGVLLTFTGCAGSPEYTQKFALSSEKPIAGEILTVYYLPDEYKEGNKVTLKVYEYKAGLTGTKDYPFEQNGKGFTVNFKLDPESRGALLIVKNGDETEDFDGQGYYLQVYDKAGMPVPGSDAGKAYAMVNWADFYLELKKDDEKALELMKNDFEKNPSIQREFAQPFLTLLVSMKNKELGTHLGGVVAAIETDNNKSEEEFNFLVNYYSQLKEAEKTNELRTAFKEKFPSAVFFQRVQVNEYYRENDLQKKQELAEKFKKDYPESEYLDDLSDIMINYLRDKKMYTEAVEYIKMNKSSVAAYRYYALGQRMFDEEYDNAAILSVADMGIEKSLAEYENPTDKKTPQESIDEWKYSRGWMAALNLFLKAQVLHDMGKSEEALGVMKKNREFSFGKDDKFNALYMELLLSAGDAVTAKSVGEEAVLKGYENAQVTGALKKAYIQTAGNDAGFDAYLSNLEKPGRDKLIKKLEKDLINEPAPAFTLSDLSGKEISLADLKGKTVVVDFWASWCGPCLQSFPGMQRAVDKYASNDKVKFIFVNAWERVTEKKQNAEEFLEKKKYTFHVLMDYENEVIGKFGVSGIPTKFILDKNGNIRFKSVGFSGNADHLVKELDAMIAMIQ